MPRKKGAGALIWTDPDDAPELTEEWFATADLYQGDQLTRRGRPKSPAPKRQVTLRLDADLLEAIRATGPGWQTRANAALRKWIERERRKAP